MDEAPPRTWAVEHLRSRDVAAWAGIPLVAVLGIVTVLVPELDSSAKAAVASGACGAVSTIIGFYFGRGQADRAEEEARAARKATANTLSELRSVREQALRLEELATAAASPEDAEEKAL